MSGAGVVVLQHEVDEDPGAIGRLFEEASLHLTAVQLGAGEPIPDLSEYDLLLVMGGTMDVWQEDQYPWLLAEKAAIREWVIQQRPFLGVCLGHQLLADALGGTVGPMEAQEVGVNRIVLTDEGRADPVLKGIGPTTYGLQWHGAEVKVPPPGAAVLATNDYCTVQAMRVGPLAYGLQFHIEVLDTTAESWGTELKQALGADVAARLEDDAATHLDALQADTRSLVSNLLIAAFGPASLPNPSGCGGLRGSPG
jgi:GMP synthase-like glutamine amidotransferase